MSRLDKHCNVVQSLCFRERGLFRSPLKSNAKIIRKLIESSRSSYKMIWRTKSKMPIQCEDGKLYLNNYSTCLTLCGINGEPSGLYRLPFPTADKRIVDALIFSGPVYHPICKPESYRSFFLALSADNWLRSYDNFNGTVLQEVYIGSASKRRYQHCDWETYGRQIVLTSTLNLQEGNRPAGQKPRVLATLVVFTVLPLEFEAMLEIDRKVFGEDCNHVNMSDGMMVIGTGSNASGSVRLYDFAQVIEEGRLYKTKLNEPFPELVDMKNGKYPAGLPMNCKLTHAPPPLYVVKCRDHIVHFGGFPWHYIATPPRFDGVFYVRNVADDTMVENGCINFPNTHFEPDHVAFHHDNSSRIIYKSAHSIRFFNFAEEQDGRLVINESHNLSFFQGKTRELEREKSRRSARASRSYTFVALGGRSILSDDYEEDMNLMGILGFDPQDIHNRGKIILFDNYSGRKIKTIELGMKLDDLDDFVLTLDLDTIVIAAKNDKRMYSCHVFRLSWLEHEAGEIGN